MFIRFVVGQRNEDSGVETGILAVAYSLLRNDAELTPDDRDNIRAVLTWFEKNLDTPKRFNRSTSKGHDRRRTRGISWLKDSAVEHLAQMHVLKGVLEKAGHSVALVRENRVGYVVWEDEHQVVAEPFNDTRTG